jgi:nitrite reductase (NADH) small subunit
LSEGIVSGRSVACPLHNWTVDLASGRAYEPDEGETETIPVRIVGDRIFIAVSVREDAAAGCATGAAA